jgi:hypothetical protein
MRYFLGVDPDLSSTACAVVDERGMWPTPTTRTCGWLCWGADNSTQEQIDALYFYGVFAAAAVENQQIIPRHAGQKYEVDPRDILKLGQVAGACVGMIRHGMEAKTPALQSLRTSPPVYFPLPVEWKGSVPKEIHQMRVLLKAGFPKEKIKKASGYCYVEGTEFKKGDWKHLADAIGLAQYAAERFLRENP